MFNSLKGALTRDTIKTFQKQFFDDPKNVLALYACAKTDPHEIGLQRQVAQSINHIYNHKVDSEIKPVTNQKSTGRCWLFASMNAMRISFAKHHLIEEFEFSQGYLFFWDKVERCNYFLHTIVEVMKRGEEIDGRLISFLLANLTLIADGGQWHMVHNLIKRYGVVPKKCFTETFSCESSHRLNYLLKTKLREYTRDLYAMHKKGSTDDQMNEQILGMMEKLYRIIVICLGSPPETITWEYYDKNKVYKKVGPISPVQFYEEHVKTCFDIDNKVVLVSDPRSENPYNKTYTVDCLGNCIGGKEVKYINVEVEKLMQFVTSSIQDNEPVWFGCHVEKSLFLKLGILDLNVYDYNLLFGVNINDSLTKAERLFYGDSMMTHAMLFTGVSTDESGRPTKFRVENSWGDDKGEKGYMMMTADWFKEYCFEVVVDKKHVPKEILELEKLEPKVLPAWDPMGSLA